MAALFYFQVIRSQIRESTNRIRITPFRLDIQKDMIQPPIQLHKGLVSFSLPFLEIPSEASVFGFLLRLEDPCNGCLTGDPCRKVLEVQYDALYNFCKGCSMLLILALGNMKLLLSITKSSLCRSKLSSCSK